MVRTSFPHLAKRLPMIKFRYGLGRDSSSNTTKNQSASSATSTATSSAASATSIPRVSSGPAIEDWQLPSRYQRKAIDQYEIDLINRGGPE